MEEGDSILETIFDDGDDTLEDTEDVEMVDVEEGELVEQQSHIDLGHSGGSGGRGGGVGGGCDSSGNQAFQSKNRKRKENKKRNRKRRGGPGPNVTDINKFVVDVCKRLKEKKSYMVYTAVGCLGVSALSDMVKEVDAIQSCGGQMTADGRRFRNGGGVLWNIMKTREPTAYKEIMKKTKEFEKQFKRQNIRQASEQKKEVSFRENAVTESAPSTVPDGSHVCQQSSSEQKHKSVHDRIRVPVSYDDLLGDNPKNDPA